MKTGRSEGLPVIITAVTSHNPDPAMLERITLFRKRIRFSIVRSNSTEGNGTLRCFFLAALSEPSATWENAFPTHPCIQHGTSLGGLNRPLWVRVEVVGPHKGWCPYPFGKKNKPIWQWLSKPMGSHFGVGAPPILEPILVGIGMFAGGTEFWILTHGHISSTLQCLENFRPES